LRCIAFASLDWTVAGWQDHGFTLHYYLHIGIGLGGISVLVLFNGLILFCDVVGRGVLAWMDWMMR
jgi:hypothetical protein